VRSLTLALLLVLAPAAAPSQDGRRVTPPVEVRVVEGRATLLQGREVVSRTAAQGTRRIEGPLELELGPGSKVEILWRGRGSLRADGPAALSLPDSSARPLEPRVELLFAARVELEVRRGTLVAALGEAGELELARSAVALGELPSGGWDLLHRGGDPVRHRAAGVAVARELRSGMRARLEPAGE
jgi:hypothetical protein